MIAVAILWAASALAHDIGCDGRAVPPEVKGGCCGAGDAHTFGSGDWRQDAKGVYHVVINGVERPIVDIYGVPIQPLPFADKCNWVWYRVSDDPGTGLTYHFYCLELPMEF